MSRLGSQGGHIQRSHGLGSDLLRLAGCSEFGLAARLRTGTFLSFSSLIAGKFHRETRTGNTILLRRPGTKVCQLTALGAERTPGIAIPGTWLAAERAGHAAILPWRVAKSGRVSLGGFGRSSWFAVTGAAGSGRAPRLPGIRPRTLRFCSSEPQRIQS
jgi:hypothetical protein